MKIIKLLKALSFTSVFFVGVVQAQLRVEVSGIGSNQMPIAVAAFESELIAPQQVSAIIKADLERSGYFKIIATEETISETRAINFGDWKPAVQKL